MDVRSLEDDLGGSVRHIAMGKVRHTVRGMIIETLTAGKSGAELLLGVGVGCFAG